MVWTRNHCIDLDSWYSIGTTESHAYERAECCPYAGFSPACSHVCSLYFPCISTEFLSAVRVLSSLDLWTRPTHCVSPLQEDAIICAQSRYTLQNFGYKSLRKKKKMYHKSCTTLIIFIKGHNNTKHDKERLNFKFSSIEI